MDKFENTHTHKYAHILPHTPHVKAGQNFQRSIIEIQKVQM